MSEEPKDYDILKRFGVKPEEGGVVDKVVKNLQGVISTVKTSDGREIRRTPEGGYTDGETLIEPGIIRGIEEIGQDGTHYNNEGKVTLEGEQRE